jgi:hypothetical protein
MPVNPMGPPGPQGPTPGRPFVLPLSQEHASLLYDAVRSEIKENGLYITRLEARIRVRRDVGARMGTPHYQAKSDRQDEQLLRSAKRAREQLLILSRYLSIIANYRPKED